LLLQCKFYHGIGLVRAVREENKIARTHRQMRSDIIYFLLLQCRDVVLDGSRAVAFLGVVFPADYPASHAHSPTPAAPQSSRPRRDPRASSRPACLSPRGRAPHCARASSTPMLRSHSLPRWSIEHLQSHCLFLGAAASAWAARAP
jgi:hypothetical protein